MNEDRELFVFRQMESEDKLNEYDKNFKMFSVTFLCIKILQMSLFQTYCRIKTFKMLFLDISKYQTLKITTTLFYSFIWNRLEE